MLKLPARRHTYFLGVKHLKILGNHIQGYVVFHSLMLVKQFLQVGLGHFQLSVFAQSLKQRKIHGSSPRQVGGIAVRVCVGCGKAAAETYPLGSACAYQREESVFGFCHREFAVCDIQQTAFDREVVAYGILHTLLKAPGFG